MILLGLKCVTSIYVEHRPCLRPAYIESGVSAGIPIESIAKMMGHASIASTQI